MSGRLLRGQLALMAILAFAVVAVLVVALTLRERAVERQAQAGVRSHERERATDLQLAAVVEGALRDSVHAAAQEVGLHGGYRAESVPPNAIAGVPYWFMDGAPLQVPSAEAMESEVRSEARGRLAERLGSLGRRPEYEGLGLALELAEFTLELEDSALLARASVAATYTPADSAKRVVLTPSVSEGLRLEHLRRRMEAVLGHLRENRTFRDHLFGVMGDDMRIPSPQGSEPATCGNVTVPRAAIVEAVAEDAALVTVQVLSQLRRNASLSEPELQWRMTPSLGGLELELADRLGNRDRVVKESVPFVLGSCQRTWQVRYNVTLPFVVSVSDLKRSARVVGGEDVSIVSLLSFNAVYEARIVENRAFERAPVARPAAGGCEGACSLALTVEDDDPSDGPPLVSSVRVEGCELALPPSRRLSASAFEGVPCGDVALEVEPSPGAGRHGARLRARLSEGGRPLLNVTLRSRARLNGTVAEQGRVLCGPGSAPSCLQRARTTALVPLGFVQGVPPLYVEVMLASLEEPDIVLTTRADEQGRFEFPTVRSGQYVVAAIPSRDEAGNPGFRVVPLLEHVAVGPGDNERTLVLQPTSPVRQGLGWTTVDRVEACASC